MPKMSGKGSGMNTGGLPHKRPSGNTGSSNLQNPPNRTQRSGIVKTNPFPQQSHTVFKFPR